MGQGDRYGRGGSSLWSGDCYARVKTRSQKLDPKSRKIAHVSIIAHPPVRRDSVGDPCTQASSGRRAFHLLVALAGWVLFIYWWIIVFRRVTNKEITSTLIFIAAATLLSVGITLGWTLHNRRIYERRGHRRNEVKIVPEVYVRDVLGRPLRFEPGLAELRRAPLVRVRIDGENKVCAAISRAGTAVDEEAVAAS